MNLIPREKLEYVSKKVLKYTLQDGEKDYFLALVLKILSESELSKDLVFKGGTAIYHCYLDQLRFSEDLDFTAINKKINIKKIKHVFKQFGIFEIKKEYTSNATLKIERLKYNGVLDVPNSLKLEIDKLQNVYLPPKIRKYQNSWGLDFKVRVMDPVEICAEKIRACNDRFRYRDFYDLFMLTQTLKISTSKPIKILPNKEIRKNISKENIMKNLKYALEEKSKKVDTVAYKKEIINDDLVKFFDNLNIPKLKPNI